MTHILQTTQNLDKEEVILEAYLGADFESAPLYASPVAILAHVKECGPNNQKAFMPTPTGSMVRTPYTLYVQGDVSPLPKEQDRLTIRGELYIVALESRPRKIGLGPDQLDHVRLRARLE